MQKLAKPATGGGSAEPPFSFVKIVNYHNGVLTFAMLLYIINTEIERGETKMLKVKIYTINEGTNSQYYGLKLAEDGNDQIIAGGKTWKSINGAKKFAEKKGYIIEV